MSHRNDRHGKALRVVLVLMFGMLALPILLGGIWMLSYRAAAANADEASQWGQIRQAEAAREYVKLSADIPPPHTKKEPQANPSTRTNPSTRNGVQPNRPPSSTTIPASPLVSAPFALPPAGKPQNANEEGAPTLVKESFMVKVPIVDSETGETSYREKVVHRYRTVYGLPPIRRAHGVEVAKLLAEIFAAKEGGKNVEEQMKELRKRLELEFSQKHKQQGNEIERIEKRLASLRELHNKRESHQAEIVDRRIDQLLGKSDGLQWETATSPFAKGYSPSSVYPPVPLQVAPAYTGPDPYKSPVPLPGPPLVSPGAPGIATVSPAFPQAFNRPPIHSYGPVPGLRGYRPDPGAQEPTPSQPTPVQQTPSQPAPVQTTPVQPTPPMKPIPPMSASSRPDNSPRSGQPVFENGVTALHRNATASSGPKQISDLFELARKIAKTESDLTSYETELEMARAQFESGDMPAASILATERECQRLRLEAKMNRAEIKAMSEFLRRDVEFAESAFKLSQQEAKRIDQLSRNGLVSGKTLGESQLDRLGAQKRLDDANAALQQYEQVLKLIPKTKSTEEPDETVPADATGNGFLVPETVQLLADESTEPAEPDSEN